MTGGITEMKSIQFEDLAQFRLPKEVLWKRIQAVLREELTEIERSTLEEYYLKNKKFHEIAQEQGVCTSTAWRNLRRAEDKMRRFLRY